MRFHQVRVSCRVAGARRSGAAVRGLAGAVLVLGASLLGCAAPQSLRTQDVLPRVAANYRAFFPAAGDPAPAQDAGLLRPRFGLPALITSGSSFTVEILERGGPAPLRLALLQPELADAQAARCLAAPAAPVPGCIPLRIVSAQREPLAVPRGASANPADPPAAVRVLYTVEATGDAPPAGYDLYIESAVDAAVRAPRSVWLRSAEVAGRPLRVAHLSDLHLGKGHSELRENLQRVLHDVNDRAPDLVVVTGDVANIGTRFELLDEARQMLLQVRAPVVVVIGNHDLGFGPTPVLTSRYGAGWANFARAFHPHLFFSLTLGEWDFIGFDSGPSVFSPRVLVRGLSDETVAAIADSLAAAQRRHSRGVILFSHAPSRAALLASGDLRDVGLFGRMRRGASAFERVLLDASPSLQVIHLAGHTHWSDVFEAVAPSGQRPERFHRWAANALQPCPQPLHGPVSLITTQSASHTSFPFRRNGEGYGFTWLTLGQKPEVAFLRYHGAVPQLCAHAALP